MRLLNKLSTGAYRFKATPVEAVRFGVACIKGPAMNCIASGGEAWLRVTWHHLSNHPPPRFYE